MRDGLQQRVPILMPQAVVDMLEIIQIQKQQRSLGIRLLRPVDLPGKIPFTAHPVV